MKFTKSLSLCLALSLGALGCKDGCRREPPPPPDANTLRIRLEQDVANLHPILTTSSYARYVAGQIFQSLGTVDPKTLELKPLIIKRLPELRYATDGPRKGQIAYDFELLDEAAWDDGKPLTGHDVAFTIKLILNPLLPTGQWRSYFEHLRGIEIDPANPKKFTAYLSEYYILGLETLLQFAILPAHRYDPAGKLANIALADLLDPKKAEALAKSSAEIKAFAEEALLPKYANDPTAFSGSNAYRLEALQPGTGAVLVRKKDWWGDKANAKNPALAAYPDKLVYRVAKEEPAALTLLQNGELDLATTIGATKFIELKSDPNLVQRFDFQTVSPASYNYILLNLRRPKLSDRRVRQALAHVIDYDYLLNGVMKGMARRTVGPINPGKPYYNRDIVPYDFNLEKAKALLTEAGWKDSDGNGTVDKNIGGQKTEMSIAVLAATASETTRLSVESLRETARKVGIGIEIVPLDLGKLSAESRAGNFEAALLAAAIFPGADDPSQYLHSRNLAPAGDNRSGFADSRADRLLDSIRSEPDLARRSALYLDFQRIVHEELPSIYIAAPEQRVIVSKRFEAVLSANRPGYYEQLFKLK